MGYRAGEGRPRNAGWFSLFWKHCVFYCWGGNQAWIKEVLPQRRMQDLGDVKHLFLGSHRSRQKPRKALIRHSQGSLISWCVRVVFVECQGKLEELKHKKPFKTQGPLSPLAKFALIRCWLHFTSQTWAPRSARHTEPGSRHSRRGKQPKLNFTWPEITLSL